MVATALKEAKIREKGQETPFAPFGSLLFEQALPEPARLGMRQGAIMLIGVETPGPRLTQYFAKASPMSIL
jgi:hypothetical protein